MSVINTTMLIRYEQRDMATPTWPVRASLHAYTPVCMHAQGREARLGPAGVDLGVHHDVALVVLGPVARGDAEGVVVEHAEGGDADPDLRGVAILCPGLQAHASVVRSCGTSAVESCSTSLVRCCGTSVVGSCGARP